ncbi:MAG: hypothetical protein IIV90_05195, partial [Oscillospiraceae bacterium]|nr:hypothetical protein [Oscillospiraceae bacterium]
VRTNIIMDAMKALLEEGEFSRARKEESRRNEAIMGVYWSAWTVIYLAVSFLTKRWDMTWIIWPVAGVGCGLPDSLSAEMVKKQFVARGSEVYSRLLQMLTQPLDEES